MRFPSPLRGRPRRGRHTSSELPKTCVSRTSDEIAPLMGDRSIAPGATRGMAGDGPPRGGAAGIRTPDLRRARAALSRLSYGPLRGSAPRPTAPTARVGAPGLEPGTSALSGPRSNHLSYAPAGRASPAGRRPRGLSCIPSGGSRRDAPVALPARCPRRSARTTRRAHSYVPATSHVAPPTSPPSVAPLPGSPPSDDGRPSGLGAHRWRICTRRLDTGPAHRGAPCSLERR